MHIMHVAGALRGGPIRAIADWTSTQVRFGHKVSLVYSLSRDPIETFRGELSSEIKLHGIDMPREIVWRLDLKACRDLIALIRHVRPDVIHLHSSKAGAVGRVAARICNVPSVYSPHGLSYLRTDVGRPSRALYFALEYCGAMIGSCTVACSPSERDKLRWIPGYKGMIPNGIALDELPSLGVEDRQLNDAVNVIICGRIAAQKDPELACEIAAASPPHWRWHWIGDGEMREAVEKGGRIQVLGWLPREQVLDHMRRADILVHTSKWEGMPIAILEGMALGLPIVASNGTGTSDLIVAGETGYLAASVQEFRSALNRLAASADLRRRMGLAGRDRVEEVFDQRKLSVRWLEVYKCLLSRDHPRF